MQKNQIRKNFGTSRSKIFGRKNFHRDLDKIIFFRPQKKRNKNSVTEKSSAELRAPIQKMTNFRQKVSKDD